MILFSTNQSVASSANDNHSKVIKSEKTSVLDILYGETEQNNSSSMTKKRSSEKSTQQRISEENYSISLMKKYPLGFNELSDENDDENKEKEGSKSTSPTPRKKKKPKKEETDNAEEEEKQEEANNKEDEEHNCFYNAWIPDCLRSKKDFIECQQINLQELETKERFEKFFGDHGFHVGVYDYEDFVQCEKSSSSRILQGIETKFGVDIDVSDSFYSLTGAKLRAYSFQGPNRRAVYSAFSYFSGTWNEEMGINSVTNYDVLFQPNDWYYSVIMVDAGGQSKANDHSEKKNQDANDANVSNKICLSKSTNKNTSNLKYDDSCRRSLNFHCIEPNSEIDSTKNMHEELIVTKKDDHIFSICLKYLKLPMLKFWKLLFSNIKTETESISCTISNVAKMVNENNNKNKDSMSINVANTSLSLHPNHELVDFLLDSYDKPIPIWINLNKTKLVNI